MSLLIPPCGGQLVNLCVSGERLDELRAYASHLPSGLHLSNASPGTSRSFSKS